MGLRSAVWVALMSAVLSAQEPWRVSEAIAAPDWLTVSGTYRLRYETLDGPFLPGVSGSDQILVERLLVGVRGDFEDVYFGAELEDARAWLDDAGTPIDTDDVNAVELLQAYAGFRWKDVFAHGDSVDVHAGRITMDVGSRRLVARNRYRNTINGFTGVHGIWKDAAGAQLRAFVVMPVERLPIAPDRLGRNASEFDDESPKGLFWGVVASRERILGVADGELYLLGLREDERPLDEPLNRRLYTPGLRLTVQPEVGEWDFEVEAALQAGRSRLPGSAVGSADLDHRAGMFHGHVGRTFAAPWSPRVVLQYDFASGDGNPTDGRNERFDTLFGARRFEYGPTGIYGLVARSNLSTPGVRVSAQPHERVTGFAGYRAVFLASRRDALTTAELWDPTGESGRFVGQQLEGRVRYALLPGNLRVEVGGAYLEHGEFLRNVPGGPGQGSTTYLYTQTVLTF